MCKYASISKTGVACSFAVAVIVSVTGCGSNSSKPIVDPDASTEAQDGGQAHEAGSPAATYCTDKTALASAIPISGSWVIRALASQQVTALGTTLHPKTLFYMLTTMTQSGSTVVANGHYCDRAEIDQPGSMVTVVMPDKWAHTEKPVNRTGTLAVGADGIPALSFPALVEFAGALPGTDTDQLPTTVDDPRVIDEDLDGNPGITINVTGLVLGSLYSVQRQVTSITATAVAGDRFQGTLTFVSDQRVLGSNPTTLTQLYSSAKAYPETDPSASTFAMVKVADTDVGVAGPGGCVPVDCAWVRSNEAVLFPQ